MKRGLMKFMKAKTIKQYKPNGKRRFIKCGQWTWSSICLSHLPMLLQKLGYKIERIEGFDEVKPLPKLTSETL